MPNLQADAMTAGPAKTIHAGVNTNIANITLGETASGSLSVSLMALPAGASIIDCYVALGNDIGTGGETLAVKDGLGNTYIQTAAASGIVRYNPDVDSVCLDRLTASTNLSLSFQALVGTITASTKIRVACSYLWEKEGD
jgi:hypothetical protein